jgi:nucleotide-binding universal stress UspA family protein
MAAQTSGARTWMVGHDFSDCADAAALLAAAEVAEGRSPAQIVLLHVFQIPLPIGVEGFPILQDVTEMERALRADALKRLDAVSARLKGEIAKVPGAPPVEIVTLSKLGTPAIDVIDEAIARHAHRIVVGTHGRRGLGRAVLGSVAERIVRMSPVPVLVAHVERASR